VERHIYPLTVVSSPCQSQCELLPSLGARAFLAEKQQKPIFPSFAWPGLGSFPQSIALEASPLTITLPMRFPIFILFLLFS
jgi:hypothetical protein